MSRPFRLHLLGLAHLPVSSMYPACAFTSKIHKLSRMLLSLGHEVYLYGAEGSDAPCTEFIQTHTLQDIRDSWGDNPPNPNFEIGYDWKTQGFKHDFSGPRTKCTLKYYENAKNEIGKRKRIFGRKQTEVQPQGYAHLCDDFLLVTQGEYQRPIVDILGIFLTCEPGVGYRGSYCRFKAFESAYLMNFTYGSDRPRESINGNYYDRVIPNYFDPKDFPFCEKKDDYFLYIGRMIRRKGVWTAIHATEAIGAKLILAGQQDPEIDVKSLPKHCEFVGYVDPPERARLMGHARAVFVPTYYLEAFGGVNAEAQLTGTPCISTNFGVFPETVLQGVTGFRCDTLNDFVEAAKKAHTLDPHKIRAWAERYLMDNVKWEYDKWFRDLYQVYLSASVPTIKGWSHIGPYTVME